MAEPPQLRERLGLLELVSDELAVTIWPGKGCDVVGLVDRRSGVDLLFRTPWGLRDPARLPFAASSAQHWTERSPGGWNLLLPHAGAERIHDGALFGFHGEAGVVPWELLRSDASSAVLTTTLTSAPLTVTRELRVDGDAFTIAEEVVNASPDPARFSWGHHPTWGAPLVGEGARLEIAAGSVRLDGGVPAVGLGGGAAGDALSGRWPLLGGTDLSVVPPDDRPRALLAYLGELQEGRYRLLNERIGLGVELTWPLELFPHAWLWQELHGSPGHPWFRRAYAMAVEPHSTAPEGGPPSLELAGGASRRAVVTARVLRR